MILLLTSSVHNCFPRGLSTSVANSSDISSVYSIYTCLSPQGRRHVFTRTSLCDSAEWRGYQDATPRLSQWPLLRKQEKTNHTLPYPNQEERKKEVHRCCYVESQDLFIQFPTELSHEQTKSSWLWLHLIRPGRRCWMVAAQDHSVPLPHALGQHLPALDQRLCRLCSWSSLLHPRLRYQWDGTFWKFY